MEGVDINPIFMRRGKGIAMETERAEQQRFSHSSNSPCREEARGGTKNVVVSESPCQSRSSQGLQVSPRKMRLHISAPSDSTPEDVCCVREDIPEAGTAAAAAAVRGAGNGRVLWRWPLSSRRLGPSPSVAKDQSPRSSDGDGSPNGILLRRRGNRTTTAAKTKATTTTKTATQKLVRVRRRGPFSRLDRHHSPTINTLTSCATPPSISPAAIGTPLSSSSGLLASLDKCTNPEHVVASMLLSHGSGGAGFEVPISPATSSSSSENSGPGWAECAGLTGGVPAAYSPFSSCFAPKVDNGSVSVEETIGCTAILSKGDRKVPRFLRPVIVLLTLSLLAIVGTRVERGMGMFGPAVHAAGGAQLPEAVVDEIFDRADKDNDGVIADEEIQYLVEGAGGALPENPFEIKAGVESVIKHLDGNADHTLSRSDLLTYWKRLGTLLTVDEVAQWVVHAAQIPQEVADNFVSNMVTGYDFPELAAHQGKLLEQDLGVTRPAFRKILVRSMKWKLWGMGAEPDPPGGLRAANASCGAVSVEWNLSGVDLNFPVHKYVVRRASLGQEGERVGDWIMVMGGPNRAFFDAHLTPGAAYRYSLQAWNALGHSVSEEIDIIVGTKDCAPHVSWWWPGGNGAEGGRGGLLLGLFFSFLAVAAGYFYYPRSTRGADTSSRRIHGNDSPLREGGTKIKSESVDQKVAVTGTSTTRPPLSKSGGGNGTGEGVVSAAAKESMRKRAAQRRMIDKRSTSREGKEACSVCHKEFPWFWRGKHTCCRCHEQYCERCGVAPHAFGACPVGGSCMCNRCLGRSSSRGSFER